MAVNHTQLSPTTGLFGCIKSAGEPALYTNETKQNRDPGFYPRSRLYLLQKREPMVGLEPTTAHLRNGCSTN